MLIAETARLRLRQWREADADAFYAAMNPAEVMRYLGGVQTPAVWRAAFDRLQSYQRSFGVTFWLLERRNDAELLGFCGLKRVNYEGAPNQGEVEVGWRLRRSAWGQGIAKEAAIAALDLAFDQFYSPSVVAITAAANRPSWGLMERLGMHSEPSLDFDDPRFPKLNPMKQWRITAEAWPAARSAALR
ncbi:MAG: GNAT family N-acetyltransferase [Sphingomonas bacterium]|nr:GNAT family N-acetyltransferase [Sphingomonas bacterium]